MCLLPILHNIGITDCSTRCSQLCFVLIYKAQTSPTLITTGWFFKKRSVQTRCNRNCFSSKYLDARACLVATTLRKIGAIQGKRCSVTNSLHIFFVSVRYPLLISDGGRGNERLRTWNVSFPRGHLRGSAESNPKAFKCKSGKKSVRAVRRFKSASIAFQWRGPCSAPIIIHSCQCYRSSCKLLMMLQGIFTTNTNGQAMT